MLLNAQSLSGFTLAGRDGDMGTAKEFFFDDHHWTIRYLIVDTGHWLPGRRVLISPYAVLSIDMEEHRIAVDLTKKQIDGSPGLLTDQPVTRQFEEEYYQYYAWPNYWSGPFMWGYAQYLQRNPAQSAAAIKPHQPPWDAHLGSTRDITGYHILATDGTIGHVDDVIIDDETWAIRYLIVDTGNWWPGRRVLIAPLWIERVDWDASTVSIALTRDAIGRSPDYVDDVRLTRAYEETLHRHYDKRGYWIPDAQAQAQAQEMPT
jgi:hypothetical protein